MTPEERRALFRTRLKGLPPIVIELLAVKRIGMRTVDRVLPIIERLIAEEREACANLVDQLGDHGHRAMLAAAIRARHDKAVSQGDTQELAQDEADKDRPSP
jgi:hypothetical protein